MGQGTSGGVCFGAVKFFAECLTELTVYVRHLAWLHAIPKNKTVDKLATKKEIEPKSRFEILREKDETCPQLELPEIFGFAYLIDYLFEAGPSIPGSMGITPLTFAELKAWVDLSGLPLSWWEISTIKRLSGAYVGEYTNASDVDRPPPYVKELTVNQAGDVSERLGTWLRSFSKLKKSKKVL